MSDEIEFKLDLVAGAHRDVAAAPLLSGSAGKTKQQLSIYFDTPKGELASAGYSLRLRHQGGSTVQTLKRAMGQGLFSRSEREWAVEGERPDLAKLAEAPLELGRSLEKLGRKLTPVLRSEVQRTSWVVERGDSRLQVDLDVGSLQAGEGTAAIEEIEFELLDGKAEDVAAVAKDFAERTEARLGVLSKAERGAALMAGTLGKVAKATPLELSRGMTVAQAFAAVVHACVRHFRPNEDLVLAERSADALHQCRVAMRRLRSALTFFRPVLRDDRDFERLREELRWFTSQLGDARNLDVYLQRELTSQQRNTVERRREEAYARVTETMDSRRARLLPIELTGWAEVGEWRKGKLAERPVAAFAGKRLDRLWGTVEPTGRTLARMGEEPRHELRIQIKKLRYAIEFFDGLYPASKRKRTFAEAVEELQEALGHLNDLATARSLANGQNPEWWRDQGEEIAQLRSAETALKRLARAGPFWRKEA